MPQLKVPGLGVTAEGVVSAVGLISLTFVAGGSGGSVGGLTLRSSPGGSTSARFEFGTDNSGWRLAFAKNVVGAVTELVWINDSGSMVIPFGLQTLGISASGETLTIWNSVGTPLSTWTSSSGLFTHLLSMVVNGQLSVLASSPVLNLTSSTTGLNVAHQFSDASTLRGRLIYAGGNGVGARYFGLINDAADYMLLGSLAAGVPVNIMAGNTVRLVINDDSLAPVVITGSPSTNGVQLPIGTNLPVVFGSLYSSAGAFMSYNSRQTTVGVDQWTQYNPGLLSFMLSLTNSGLTLYAAAAGTANGALVAFFAPVLGIDNTGTIRTTSAQIAVPSGVATTLVAVGPHIDAAYDVIVRIANNSNASAVHCVLFTSGSGIDNPILFGTVASGLLTISVTAGGLLQATQTTGGLVNVTYSLLKRA